MWLIYGLRKDTQLVGLQDPVQDLVSDVDQRVASLLPEQAKIQAQLGVSGPVPTDDVTMEKPDIAQQRSVFIMAHASSGK